MKTSTLENLAKFFYDSGKVSFAVLVIGVIARKPFASSDLLWGSVLTLLFLFIAIIIDELKKERT